MSASQSKPERRRRGRIAVALALSALLLAGCEDSVRPEDPAAWSVQRTTRGFVATVDDWLVLAGNGDLSVGLVTGVTVYYRGEPVGGGGIYDFESDGRVWNEWVPFLVPTNPGYSELRSFATRRDTLVVAFADTVPLPPSATSGGIAPGTLLKFDLRIVPDGSTLDVELGGMHMVFFPIRVGEAYTISCRSVVAARDTTLTISPESPDWATDFAGPSSYEVRSAHFTIAFATDAPLTKVGVGREAVADGGLVKLDLDHSLRAEPPRHYVNSRLTITAQY